MVKDFEDFNPDLISKMNSLKNRISKMNVNLVEYNISYENDFVGYVLAIVTACVIKIVGYYIAEALIYGNWVQPVLSIPGNLIQIGVAAVIVLPVAAVLKKALRKEVASVK